MKKTVKIKHFSRGWRFRGITQDARTLGVTHSHLWRVLMGQRDSKPLLARYRALQRKKERAA
jgi:hypothetical protein